MSKIIQSEIRQEIIEALRKDLIGPRGEADEILDENPELSYLSGTLHTVDKDSEIEFDDKKQELTKNESKILYTLIKSKEKIVSRDELMKCLWQSDEFVDDNTLTVNINRLRKKLEEIGAVGYLQTKRGQGYILA